MILSPVEMPCHSLFVINIEIGVLVFLVLYNNYINKTTQEIAKGNVLFYLLLSFVSTVVSIQLLEPYSETQSVNDKRNVRTSDENLMKKAKTSKYDRLTSCSYK